MNLLLCLALGLAASPAAQPAPADRAVRLDDQGVLRWTDNDAEVALFGVNYYAAHWNDYIRLGVLGMDRRKVVEQDVAHWRRLGIDLLRVHVFDREISDRDGNLVANDHLAVLDHLLATCRRNGLHAVLTPMAWWDTPGSIGGFSSLYTMPQMTGDPGAPRAAQRRYLAQFVAHRNPETGLTLGEDPQIIAFELINEPIYPPGTTDAQVTAYVDALVDAVRGAGCRKLLFYNMWGRRGQALANSHIDGVTHSWYPTGLASGAMITANMLPRVARYTFFDEPAVAHKPKGLYEFDAADVHWPYMYPAIARAFRAAGAQFAAQFQYDTWPLAATNCDWNTHYLSLPYAPGKALSFMIGGEAFHRLPRGPVPGDTPGSERFGDFRTSFSERLSELVTDTVFLHSAPTRTAPPNPAALTRLAGVGGSPVVDYDGSGAWFLDRIAPGQWRLEVYPDAVLVDDPYGQTNLEREVTRLIWATRTMALRLPDLGADFDVEPLDAGNAHRPMVTGGRFALRPGVYRLHRRDAGAPVAMDAAFFAPPERPDLPPKAWHRAPDELLAGHDLDVVATVVPETARATLRYRDGQTWRAVPMTAAGPYLRRATLPAAAVKVGELHYGLAIEDGGHALFFPGGGAAPADEEPVRRPQLLFDAAKLTAVPDISLGDSPGQSAHAEIGNSLKMSVTAFGPRGAVGVRLPVVAPTAAPGRWRLRVRARAVQLWTNSLEVGLVQDDGRAYGCDLPLVAAWRDFDVPLDALHTLWSTNGGTADPARLKELSLVFGTWTLGDHPGRPQACEVQRVELAPLDPGFAVPVVADDGAVRLLRAATTVRPHLTSGGDVGIGEAPDGTRSVVISHPGFGPAPDSTSLRLDIGARPEAMARCTKLRFQARALTPAATMVELVLSEDDGAPWGRNLPLKESWTTVEVPLSELDFWRGWSPPPGRGGPGDHVRPAHLTTLNLTFGSWLNPKHEQEPWQFEVAAVDLVP
jgi:hypothetical protein